MSATSSPVTSSNELKQAGVTLDSAAGQQIATLVTEKLRLEEAQNDLNESVEYDQQLFDEGRQLTESLLTPTEIYANEIERLNELPAAGAITQDTFNRVVANTNQELLEVSKGLSAGIQRALEDYIRFTGDVAANAENIIGNTLFNLEDVLTEVLTTGKFKVKDFFNALIEDLTRAFVRMAIIAPLMNMLLGMFGGGGAGSAFAGALAGLFARGGAFDHGRVLAFAGGGIIESPTIFPMAHGMGLMGEAGPEAIMPLHRDSGGNLGVIATAAPVEVIINNYSGEKTETKQTQQPGGRQPLEIAIGQAMAQDVKTRGPMSQSLESAYGLQRRGRN